MRGEIALYNVEKLAGKERHEDDPKSK